MCGRLNITSDPLTQLLMEAFGLAAEPRTNHNLAPTEPLLVIRPEAGADSGLLTERSDAADQGYRANEMRWWLTPSWSRGPDTKYAMFNAKSETVADKRSFARPFRSQRCVIPVTGYYEWQKGRTGKLPFYVHAENNAGLLLAGLWDQWTDPETGEPLESCTIVTAAADDALSFLHHRQPVFLSADEAHSWLDGSTSVDALGQLMAPHLPSVLQIDPVSTYVNNARNKDERCVQPIADPLTADSLDRVPVDEGRATGTPPNIPDLFDTDP